MRRQRSTMWFSGGVDHPSQWRRLAKDPFAHVPVEGLLGPDMDLYPKQILEILNQPSVIHQTRPGSQATSKSRPLFSLASLRATEPNTRKLCAPRRPASRRISSRRSVRNVSSVTISLLCDKRSFASRFCLVGFRVIATACWQRPACRVMVDSFPSWDQERRPHSIVAGLSRTFPGSQHRVASSQVGRR
jgi:hypothetical protein